MRNINESFLEHTKHLARENALAPDPFTAVRLVRVNIEHARDHGLDPTATVLASNVYAAFLNATDEWQELAASWVRSSFNKFGYGTYSEVVARMIEEVTVENDHTGLIERLFSKAISEVNYGKLH